MNFSTLPFGKLQLLFGKARKLAAMTLARARAGKNINYVTGDKTNTPKESLLAAFDNP